METTKTKCLNGYIQAGDLVISTPDDDYACLIGRVLQINLLGTPEHDEETDNETDDVHVSFMEFDYSKKRVAEIEAMFTELYGEKKRYGDSPIDDAIMAPDCLLSITGINDSLLQSLLQSGFNAASYCYGILSEIMRQSGSSAEDIINTQPDIKAHIFDVIDSAVARAGYKVLDGDGDSVIIRHSDSDTDYEIKVIETTP